MFRYLDILMMRIQFDTVGLLARSPGPIVKIVESCANLTQGQHLVSNHFLVLIIQSDAKKYQKPSCIIYPTDWLPMRNKQQQRMIDLFLEILTNSTGVQVQRLSLEAEWSRTGPEGVRDMTLSKYLDMVRFNPVVSSS